LPCWWFITESQLVC